MVGCSKCGQTWERDPALEVACPKCQAKVGAACVAKRPSEHRLSAAFAGLTTGVHAERDLLAMREVPGYGRCPKASMGPRAASAGADGTLTLNL